MKTEINGIGLELQELIYISNRGIVAICNITSFDEKFERYGFEDAIKRDTMSKALIYQKFLPHNQIVGVESYATMHSKVGHSIGLLLGKTNPIKLKTDL